MRAPTARYEVNVNTIIQIVGFVAMIAGLGVTWGQMSGRIDEQERTVMRHGTNIESLREEAAKIDNLSYRVTVTEQAQSQLTRSVEELKALVNTQGADIRVIREVVSRVEKKLDGDE